MFKRIISINKKWQPMKEKSFVAIYNHNPIERGVILVK